MRKNDLPCHVPEAVKLCHQLRHHNSMHITFKMVRLVFVYRTQKGAHIDANHVYI
jgi:hypothetical protein